MASCLNETKHNEMEIACSVCILTLANSSLSTEFHTTRFSHRKAVFEIYFNYFLLHSLSTNSKNEVNSDTIAAVHCIRMLMEMVYVCIFWISRIGLMLCGVTMHLENDIGPPEQHWQFVHFHPYHQILPAWLWWFLKSWC